MHRLHFAVERLGQKLVTESLVTARFVTLIEKDRPLHRARIVGAQRRPLAREIDQSGRKETNDRSELRRDHQSYVAPNVVSLAIPERKKDQVPIK
jgi:hypothetical protein